MDERVGFDEQLLPRERHYRPRRLSQAASWRLSVVLVASLLAVYIVCQQYYFLGTETSLIAVVAVFAIELWVWVIWRARTMNPVWIEVNNTAALLNSGQVAEAARVLDDLCHRAQSWPEVHALAVHNRAVGYLRQGQTARALSLFGAALNSGCFQNERHPLHQAYPLLLGHLALCYAIQGNLEAAEQWQMLAHEHLPPEKSGMLLVTDVLIGVRRDRYAVMVKDAEAAWLGAEGYLLPASMRGLRLLCAFALAYLNAGGAHTEQIRQYTEGAKPCRPGEFDYLAAQWPEFRTFLINNGFAEQPAALSPAPAAQANRRV